MGDGSVIAQRGVQSGSCKGQCWRSSLSRSRHSPVECCFSMQRYEATVVSVIFAWVHPISDAKLNSARRQPYDL